MHIHLKKIAAVFAIIPPAPVNNTARTAAFNTVQHESYEYSDFRPVGLSSTTLSEAQQSTRALTGVIIMAYVPPFKRRGGAGTPGRRDGVAPQHDENRARGAHGNDNFGVRSSGWRPSPHRSFDAVSMSTQSVPLARSAHCEERQIVRGIATEEMKATRKYPIRWQDRRGCQQYIGNRVVVVAAGPERGDGISTTYRSPSRRCWRWLDDAHSEPYEGLARPVQQGSIASASELALLNTFGDGVTYLRVDAQRGTLSFGYGVSMMRKNSHADNMEPASRPPTEEEAARAFTYDLVDANIKLEPSAGASIGVEIGSAQLKIPRQPSRDLPGRFLEWEQHGEQAACLVEMWDNEQDGGGEALDRVLKELQILADRFAGMYLSRSASTSRMPFSA